MLVADELGWVFQDLLIYWDFHIQPSQWFTKKRSSVSGEVFWAKTFVDDRSMTRLGTSMVLTKVNLMKWLVSLFFLKADENFSSLFLLISMHICFVLIVYNYFRSSLLLSRQLLVLLLEGICSLLWPWWPNEGKFSWWKVIFFNFFPFLWKLIIFKT